MMSKKYKVDDFVRVKFGCLWLFGIIAEVKHDCYEVHYGCKKGFQKHKNGDGDGLGFFADFKEDEIELLDI